MDEIKNKQFTSIDKLHSISTTIIGDIAWFQISNVEFEKYKTFLLLLKDCIEYFNENNVKYIKQHLSKNDIEFVKNSTFIELDENTYIVSTPILKFIDEIVSLLGIKRI